MKPLLSQDRQQALLQVAQRCYALTGGIASGKSTALQVLQNLGYQVWRADDGARDVSAMGTPGAQRILQHFGQEFFQEGQLRRAALRHHIFTHPEKRELLEKLLHPLIEARFLWQVLAADARPHWLFYEIPLLFEKKKESLYRGVVVVQCSAQQQLRRLQERDGLSLAEAQLILEAQMPLADKAQKADYILSNDSDDPQDLKPQITEMLRRMSLRAKQKR